VLLAVGEQSCGQETRESEKFLNLGGWGVKYWQPPWDDGECQLATTLPSLAHIFKNFAGKIQI